MPPIYLIKTMDVCVENPGSVSDDAEEESGSAEAAIKDLSYEDNPADRTDLGLQCGT